MYISYHTISHHISSYHTIPIHTHIHMYTYIFRGLRAVVARHLSETLDLSGSQGLGFRVYGLGRIGWWGCSSVLGFWICDLSDFWDPWVRELTKAPRYQNPRIWNAGSMYIIRTCARPRHTHTHSAGSCHFEVHRSIMYPKVSATAELKFSIQVRSIQVRGANTPKQPLEQAASKIRADRIWGYIVLYL